MFAKTVWETLSKVDCAKHIEKKGSLSYLSWAWAWAELMSHFPESTYEQKPDVIHDGGSVEVGFVVTVRDGDQSLSRDMWLPVMNNTNKAISNPDSCQYNYARMRCLVKCLAMFGLGHYIYAGEDLPQAPSPEEQYAELVMDNSKSIEAIKTGIANNDLSTAAEAWFELSDDVKAKLWKAPTKGGCFTTKEREVLKSSDFRKAHYGEEQ